MVLAGGVLGVLEAPAPTRSWFAVDENLGLIVNHRRVDDQLAIIDELHFQRIPAGWQVIDKGEAVARLQFEAFGIDLDRNVDRVLLLIDERLLGASHACSVAQMGSGRCLLEIKVCEIVEWLAELREGAKKVGPDQVRDDVRGYDAASKSRVIGRIPLGPPQRGG